MTASVPTRTALVLNAGDGTVSVVDLEQRAVIATIDAETGRVLATLAVPAGLRTVADPSTGVAWVVNYDATSVSVTER